MSDKTLHSNIQAWVKSIGPFKKFPVYFIDHPEANEGLDLLIELAYSTCLNCIHCKDMNSGNLKCSKLRDIVDSDFYCKKWEKK